MLFDWSGVAGNLVAGLIGFGARYGWDLLKVSRRRHGQGAFFTGIEDPLFVFPPRGTVTEAILPRISTEDFMAINNLISAFMKLRRVPLVRVRDPDHLTDQDKKQNNLILICSSRRNRATEEALALLKAQYGHLADYIPSFETSPETGHLRICFYNATYESRSFVQDGPDKDDVALIVKAKNPWADERKILIVAGVRGIGTWGAAEFLKKWWRPLYERKKASRKSTTSKQGEFAAVVLVLYKAYDIKGVRLLNVVDLDEAFHEMHRSD